jgi:hypothetical protein
LSDDLKALPTFQPTYQAVQDFLQTAQTWTFEQQLLRTFHRFITPLASQSQSFNDVNRLIASYRRQAALVDRLQRLTPRAQFPQFARYWMGLLKHGVVADTPNTPQTIDPNALVIASPQKLIDFNVKRPLYLWLDVSATDWARTDTAPLYHAWVHSASWDWLGGTQEGQTLPSPQEEKVPRERRMRSLHPANTTSPVLRRWRFDHPLLKRRGKYKAVKPIESVQDPSPCPAPMSVGGEGSSTLKDQATMDALTRHRAGHLTRGLMMLSTQHIMAFSSQLDDLGELQQGWLAPRLVLPTPTGETLIGASETRAKRLLDSRNRLRDDQKAVLAYTGGTMALSAVPGAGKTFVNVELIIQLVLGGFPGGYPNGQPIPADKILVLTYMDSAAKTLIQRLRHELNGLSQTMPAISTIHGLARRILSDGDAVQALGYTLEDMTLLDDTEQQAILQQVAQATLPEGDTNADSWKGLVATGISLLKSRDMDLDTWLARLKRLPTAQKTQDILRMTASFSRLQPAVEAYKQTLHSQGKIDFDDLILSAIKVLERSDSLRDKLQQRYTVIIEDEAQDSSPLLQRFLRLLGGSQPNLIRTGDTNQSILGTFTAADPEGFRSFIKQAQHVVTMTQSGRCAPQIINLANSLVLASSCF